MLSNEIIVRWNEKKEIWEAYSEDLQMIGFAKEEVFADEYAMMAPAFAILELFGFDTALIGERLNAFKEEGEE